MSEVCKFFYGMLALKGSKGSQLGSTGKSTALHAICLHSVLPKKVHTVRNRLFLHLYPFGPFLATFSFLKGSLSLKFTDTLSWGSCRRRVHYRPDGIDVNWKIPIGFTELWAVLI